MTHDIEIDVEATKGCLDTSSETILLDVREPEEWDAGHLANAVHIPLGALDTEAEAQLLDKSAHIVCYCRSGMRSLDAVRMLRDLRFPNTVSMAGGIEAWDAAGYPIVTDAPLSDDERQRYQRHITIPDVGLAGQLKLRDAKVLLVGAGGLGSPAAYYLAAAGVGTIGIVDDDVVDVSNLQRQIVHSTQTIGEAKVTSAQSTLQALNPHVHVVPHHLKLAETNAAELFTPYDMILDGSDNFPTRYIVNDTCVAQGKPNIHGSVYRFEGQVSVFWGGQGPCYRCLYPEPPPPEMAPSCAEAGVLGILPGIIGLLEATEAIKLILRTGDPLIGRLICYNALKTEFRELTVDRDPQCAVCGR